jgi:anti-sigma regulatory factor (Ser/Thr protein kinase)
MADGPHPGEPAGRGDRVRRGWPGPILADGAVPALDLRFDPDTLQVARTRTRACVSRAGFPEDRAEDVILAVHELAANAIVHGGGAGRLRVWNLAGALLCQVDDEGLDDEGLDDTALDDRGWLLATGRTTSPAQVTANSLPCEPGHGLWVVRRVADQLQSLSGPAGTSVLIRFGHGTTRYSG